MSISSIQSVSPQLSASQAQPGSLSQKSFLKILAAQIQSQDPFSSNSSSDPLSQISQMESLANSSSTTAALSSIEAALASFSVETAAALIGKTAYVPTSSFSYQGNGVQSFSVNLSAAENVGFSVLDSTGSKVASIPASDLPQGTSFLKWNGLLADGSQAPTGQYSIMSSDGSTIAYPSTITAVSQSASGVVLDYLNGTSSPMSATTAITS